MEGKPFRSKPSQREVSISKCLSYILRHGAVELGLSIRADGYVPLVEVLEVASIKSKWFL
jgi:2'-phosphotransferase